MVFKSTEQDEIFQGVGIAKERDRSVQGLSLISPHLEAAVIAKMVITKCFRGQVRGDFKRRE